jgi:hypothetical protein
MEEAEHSKVDISRVEVQNTGSRGGEAGCGGSSVE